MRGKFVVGLLLAVTAVVGVLFWQAKRPAKVEPESASVATTATVVPNDSPNPSPAARPHRSAYPRLVIKAKFKNDPVKPEDVDRLQTGMDEKRELDFFQVQTASKLLRSVHPLDGDQNGHVRKNNLMNALNRQSNLQDDIVDLYATIYRDPEQNEVIRDYAIQHVYEAYPRLTADNLKSDAISLLREAANQADTSTAGTAILALARLAQGENGVAREEIATKAFELARDPEADPSARISALQVIGWLDPQAAMPLLVQTARTGDSVTLQLSAIGSLGLVGGRNEIELLRGIAEGGNERLKYAATVALQRIQERMGTL